MEAGPWWWQRRWRQSLETATEEERRRQRARRHASLGRVWAVRGREPDDKQTTPRLVRGGHSPPEMPQAGGAELARGKATRSSWSMWAYV
jgi:hypothetical protein